MILNTEEAKMVTMTEMPVVTVDIGNGIYQVFYMSLQSKS